MKVNVVQVPNDDYKQRLVVAMSGGQAPDVFASWGGGWLEEFVKSGQVKDLTNEDIEFDRFIETALENATYDNKIYGLPLGISPYIFYYNKEIFEKYGLEVPETYDDLLEIVDVLKENDVYPIALANQPKWPGAFFLMYFVDRLGGEDVFKQAYRREGKGFDDEVFVKAGEYIQDLVNKGAFNPGFNVDSLMILAKTRQLMYTGQAAMVYCKQVLLLIMFVKNFLSLKKKWGYFRFPKLEEGIGDPTI